MAAFLYRPDGHVSDLTVTFWPNIRYIQKTWQMHGQIPLWRTLIFCGSPFDADPQSGLWYPPNLVFTALSPAVGFNLLFIAHTIWGGWGMWRWSRATNMSPAGSLLAALAYAFTPKTLAHLGFGHVGLVYAAAWVPWVLWAAYRLGHGSWPHVTALGLALGLQGIAHPQLAFYSGLVAGVYGLAVSCTTERQTPIARRASRFGRYASGVARMFLGGLLAVGLAAVQLLPLLRLAPLTARSSMGFSETAVSSLPLRYLWGLILADHGGFMDYVLYVGVPVLALALLALRRRQAWFWWSFVCLALVYALGNNTPLYGLAFRLLPALAWLRAPSRVWFIAAAALALMAGWGVDRILRGLNARGRRWLNRVALALGSLALVLLVGYAIGVGKPPNNLVAFGLVTPLTAALCAAAAARRLPPRPTVVALVVLLLADLWVVGATMVEGRSPNAVFAGSDLGAYLARQQDGQPFRIYSPSYSLPRHIAARYGLETADGVDPLYLQAYAAWMEAASGVPRTGYIETVPSLEGSEDITTANRDANPDARLLGLLNVRYVAAEFPVAAEGLLEVGRFGATRLYENRRALPRAFAVGVVEPVKDFDAALAWVQNNDVGHAAAVENGRPLSSGEVEANIAWVRRSPNRLALDVTLDRPGFLLLSQVWYPSWRAKVDGEPVTFWKADGALSGVYLEAGNHRVAFAYRPKWTLIGGVISVITWMTVAGTIAWSAWKRSRAGRSEDN